MTIFVAILGLGLLVFIHELGHFTVSLVLGMRPRRFYVGFPPAIWKTTRRGIEYGVGAIPLGGFVKIPGMHRPAPVDVDGGTSRALQEAPSLGGAVSRLRNALAADDHDAARDALAVLRSLAAEHPLSPVAASALAKSLDDLEDALGPDAYWRAKTWKRVAVIAAGPAANIMLALVLFTGLYMTSVGRATTAVDQVSAGSPAAKAGLRSGDTIVSIDDKHVEANDIAEAIASSNGKPLTLVVARDATLVVLPATSARLNDGRYRLGFILAGEGLPFNAAAGESLSLTWRVAPRRDRPGLLRRGETGDRELPLRPGPDLAFDRIAQPVAAPPAGRRPHRLRDRRRRQRQVRPARDLRAGLGRGNRARSRALRDRPHERHRQAFLTCATRMPAAASACRRA